MRIWSTLLIAAPVAVGLLAAPAANADWRDQRGWHGDRGWHGGGYRGGYHHDNGDAAAAAILGLGAAAIIGGVIASQQPRYYAPPPPVVYAPPPPYYSGYSQLTECFGAVDAPQPLLNRVSFPRERKFRRSGTSLWARAGISRPGSSRLHPQSTHWHAG